jgi:hypothetical protein
MADTSVTALRHEFESTGSVLVSDFLHKVVAERLARYIEAEMRPDWWFASTYPGRSGQRTDIRDVPENAAEIEHLHTLAHSQLSSGGFSYAFFRTLPHLTDCACPCVRQLGCWKAPTR